MQAKNILVIDKDIITRKFLKQTLEKGGHRVLQAELGKEGLVFAWRDKPDVIIVDPILPDLSGELLIQKIRQDARTANTPVIVLSSETSEAFGQACLQQGYSYFYPKLGNAIPKLVQQLETIIKPNGSPLLQKSKNGKLFVFLSGKGGTGVSSLAANIATSLKMVENDANIALVDMVLPLGSLASLVGYRGSVDITTLADLPPEEIRPEFVGASLPHLEKWEISLLAGAPNPEAANLLQAKKIPHLLETLRDEFDYVLVDLGRSLSRISLPVIQQAHLVNLVFGADRESVRLTKIIYEYLLGLKIDKTRVNLILNRAIGTEGMNKTDVETHLSTEVKATIPYMGESITTSNNQAEAVVRKYPNHIGSMMLMNLTKAILKDAHQVEV